ncbi:MAG TPA: DUF971 domain-containing protein [Sandaracinaceae bacterium LLY-WYZ-13_1]|nr:DUF971 domain-containing protein [Sandaracinaceae bacterium LLY-WYZ-13_1]
MSQPVELRAPEGARRMEIDWDDGTTTAFHHAILRGFCPCAHCQGHHGPVRWVEGAEEQDLSLATVEQVGNYALQLGWGDGHVIGIYTFRFLRSLADVGEASVDEVRDLRFER